MNTSFTETQAEALRAALAARAGERGALGYCELAGFLFALACSPDPVMPSEWIPVVLGEAHGDFASPEEAQRVMDLMMALHNHINVEVAQRKPALPPGIEVRANPMENFGPQAPLGQWAGGYGAGQLWLEETWEACLRGAPEARDEAFDDALGSLNAALSFFTHRSLAETWLPKDARRSRAAKGCAADIGCATRGDGRAGRAGARPGRGAAQPLPYAGTKRQDRPEQALSLRERA